MFKLIFRLWVMIAGFTVTPAFSQNDTAAVQQPGIRPERPITPEAVQVKGKALTGMAGIYSSKADGTKTANGEIFDNKLFTAACNKFKFNTWLRITNLKNHSAVLVRVNDRNSRKKTAPLIELSRSAVAVLGFLKTGSAKVKVEETVLNDSLQIKLKESLENTDQSATSDNVQKPDTVVVGKAITGIASFYSANLDGTKTATGERYRNAKLTAASNNFKLNTWVRITNLRNKKTVVVRINDRMHPRMKKKGRVVDLSREAARILDFMDDGLVKVKVEPIAFKMADTVTDKQVGDTLAATKDTIPSLLVDSLSKQSALDQHPTDSIPVVTGIASFYSASLEGTKTANGERYHNKKLSAASNEFALGTWVRITNLSNQKKVVLRINDRMHPSMQAKGRVADLSRAAAQKLEFINKGLTKVKMEPVKQGTLN